MTVAHRAVEDGKGLVIYASIHTGVFVTRDDLLTGCGVASCSGAGSLSGASFCWCHHLVKLASEFWLEQ